MRQDKIILGIDPGTNIMGYGAIHIIGNDIRLLGAGIISMEKLKDQPLKMKRIFESTIDLLEQFKPDELSIEAPFFGKNVQSMLKLGRAQGIAIAAALVRGVPIFEYSPKKIKQSVTGNGNATKEQVAAMLQKIVSLPPRSPLSPKGREPERKAFDFTELKYLDSTDALGAAICHYFHDGMQSVRNSSQSGNKKVSGWKAFLAENPGRNTSPQPLSSGRGAKT
ncbi:MAG: crossover junction endodeoxyribonuclease RuvC [Bacteroidetes bacterium]|nr:MAG: crossover junction endodeoxyribonuclease RuvC [Bacteroidota bacterium]